MAKTKGLQVVEINEGIKIPYRVSGTKIFFGGDDDLMVNLAKYQRDWPVHIDICADRDGCLVVGAAAGRDYVAQIDVPGIRYEEAEAEADGAESRTPLPMDMADVVLTLWSIDALYII